MSEKPNRIYQSKYDEIYIAAGSRADSVARAMADIEIMEDPVEVQDAPAPSSEGPGAEAGEGEGAEQNAAAEGAVSPETPES